MEIKVSGRSKDTCKLIETLAKFYATELGLTRSKYKLTIFTVTGLARDGRVSGSVFAIGDKQLIMGIDSRLKVAPLIESLAHEMVHVKQLALGQLKHVSKPRGKSHYLWLGKRYNKVDYYDSPWELEAYGRQANLANKVNRILMKNQ